MTAFIYADNVNTTLASPLSSSATSLTLASSANLPASIPAGMVLVITLNDQATRQNFEIIYATSISGATLSGLMRGQEGTSAQNWLVGDFAWNGITAGQMRSLATGRYLGTTVITASGNFTPNPAATTTRVRGSGGGGSGAGAAATGSGQASCGSGGSCGSYAEIIITGAISGTVACTIGAGGATAVGASGSAGGTTTFGTYLSLPGGPAGTTETGSPPFFVSGSANSSLPTITGAQTIEALPGVAGGAGYVFAATGSGTVAPGRGVANALGLAGAPPVGYGTGGNGSGNIQNSSAIAGSSPGQQGILIIDEYA